MTPLIVVICVLIVVIGVPFTLGWWRVADQWSQAEDKRFKPKRARPGTPRHPNATVIHEPESEHHKPDRRDGPGA